MVKMNLKKRMPLIVLIVGVVSLISAVLMLIFAIPNSNAAYKTVLNIIFVVLLLQLTGLSFFYLYITRDNDPNFFL